MVTGDKLNGAYNEVLTINADNTFGSQGFAFLTQLLSGEGFFPVPSQLSNAEPTGYRLYATFAATGVALGPTGFSGLTGSFSLFADPDQNSIPTFGADGFTPVSVAAALSGDDVLLASASNDIKLIGFPGTPGAFDFIWDDFTLTTAGSAYFIAPDPFHMTVRVNGDFDQLNPVGVPDEFGAQDFLVTGDVSAVFQVPEPATLALFGLGLAGLGFGARRKAK